MFKVTELSALTELGFRVSGSRLCPGLSLSHELKPFLTEFSTHTRHSINVNCDGTNDHSSKQTLLSGFSPENVVSSTCCWYLGNQHLLAGSSQFVKFGAICEPCLIYKCFILLIYITGMFTVLMMNAILTSSEDPGKSPLGRDDVFFM